MQVDAAVRAYWPKTQPVQALEPGFGAWVPIPQSTQYAEFVDPVTARYFPLGQPTQPEAPRAAWLNPAAQLEHALKPAEDAKKPAAQLVQLDGSKAPVAAPYWPTPHMMQFVDAKTC